VTKSFGFNEKKEGCRGGATSYNWGKKGESKEGKEPQMGKGSPGRRPSAEDTGSDAHTTTERVGHVGEDTQSRLRQAEKTTTPSGLRRVLPCSLGGKFYTRAFSQQQKLAVIAASDRKKKEQQIVSDGWSRFLWGRSHTGYEHLQQRTTSKMVPKKTASRHLDCTAKSADPAFQNGMETVKVSKGRRHVGGDKKKIYIH